MSGETETIQRISIFPIGGALLFPRMHLPLHIFEPRYRALISDAMARGPEEVVEGNRARINLGEVEQRGFRETAPGFHARVSGGGEFFQHLFLQRRRGGHGPGARGNKELADRLGARAEEGDSAMAEERLAEAPVF